MSATVSFKVASAHGEQNVTLSYTRQGSGEPLLLLHGIGHHRQVWDPVIPALAAERDVIAVDLPGCGASPALPDGMAHDLPTMNTVLAALCEALDIERPHVAGNSLGGLLALELARAQLVRSVTALSPAGFWNEAERRYAFTVLMTMRQIAQRMPLSVVERLSRPAIGRTLLTSTIYARPGRRSPEAVVAETLALARAQGFSETLRSGRTVQFTDDIVGTPVTVAWGNRDRLLIPRQGVRAKSVIPSARLVRLPGCGHVPMNDDPALVARVVLDGSR
ncbi:putative Dihydrolipoyllysine-residue acetyltransferase component of acetoin cleaving system [Streptomyces afghaniensis 772]|uniref:Putative Dihydrolipoyllysine-residue acetyltransferase component of acetoin cleaving system n=1 Tax=Streptomyces afghaniensis 772 TaxID=1283301 RepID=S4MEM9_9ACTN|nr:MULTISPECIES: alpha/beta fold hydrolase [Streptomyces]EPJ33970.1 putative Dihydrolipoyllysine-residue acetyltransferase component of acetoin cleaving system [Streptomyces afghaniensis 772]UOB14386.1 alpha/beta fold hydrolase [Streptomyces sp. HP-A2021]